MGFTSASGPQLPVHDERDQALAHAKVSRKRSPGRAAQVCRTDEPDFGGRQFVSGMSLAAHHSPLACRVDHVVSMRARDEVRRVHAFPVVAGVQKVQAVGDRAIRQFVGHPVCTLGLLLDSNASIPSLQGGAGPVPALGRLVDLGPKPLTQVPLHPLGLTLTATRPTAEVPLSPMRGRTVELRAACVASNRRSRFSHIPSPV